MWFFQQHTLLTPVGSIVRPPLASKARYSLPLLFLSKNTLNHCRKVRATLTFFFISDAVGMYWSEERHRFKSRTVRMFTSIGQQDADASIYRLQRLPKSNQLYARPEGQGHLINTNLLCLCWQNVGHQGQSQWRNNNEWELHITKKWSIDCINLVWLPQNAVCFFKMWTTPINCLYFNDKFKSINGLRLIWRGFNTHATTQIWVSDQRRVTKMTFFTC